MRRLALVALAACSSPTSTSTPAVHHVAAIAPSVTRAGHASKIEIVAITDDGKAAVTQDAMGGTRLWPALDGSLEPIVVHATAARELAIGRDGTGLVIATLDPAGALELVRISATGAQISRTQIRADVATEQVVMIPSGILALRADQTLVVLTPAGVETAHLVPPRGERIASLVSRGGHAVALFGTTAITARELTFDPLGWAKPSPPFTLTIARPVLSPDGRYVAMQTEDAGVVVIELATGAIARKELCLTAASRSEPGDTMTPMLRQAELHNVAPLGFVDDHTVVCFALGKVVWWGIDGKRRPGEQPVAAPETVAVANGLTVMTDHATLVLASAGATKYLGYGMPDALTMRGGPLGITVGRANHQLLLDRGLRARNRYELPADAHELDDAMPLDDTHILVSHADSATTPILHRLAIVDTTTHRATPLPLASTAYELRYERSTHMIAIVEPDRSLLVTLDPKTFAVVAKTALPGPARAVFLTDPALANGVVAIGVTAGDGRVKVDEIATTNVNTRRRYEVFGDVLAVDRAGRVYVGDGDTVSIYVGSDWDQAKRVAKLAQLGHVVVRPNSDATEVLVIGDNRLRMYDLEGNQRWMVAAPTAIDGAWIGGEPYVRFSAGLAKIDALTGSLLDRACGWGFQLSAAPLDSAGDSRSVCDEG